MPDDAQKLTTECDSCGKRITFRPDKVGQTVKCPNCKAPLELPAPDTAPKLEFDAPAEAIPEMVEGESLATKPPRKDPLEPLCRHPKILLALCGVLAFVVITAFLWGITAVCALKLQLADAEGDYIELAQTITDALAVKSLKSSQQELVDAMPWLKWKHSKAISEITADFGGAQISIDDDMTYVSLIGTFGENSVEGSSTLRRREQFFHILDAVRKKLTPKWTTDDMLKFSKYVVEHDNGKYIISTSSGDVMISCVTLVLDNPPIRIVNFEPY